MNKLEFDISKLSEYREDYCLEIKKATNGLPNSIWETYSSFTISEIADLMSIKSSRSRDYWRMLVDRGVVVTNGANKNRTYTLSI